MHGGESSIDILREWWRGIEQYAPPCVMEADFNKLVEIMDMFYIRGFKNGLERGIYESTISEIEA